MTLAMIRIDLERHRCRRGADPEGNSSLRRIPRATSLAVDMKGGDCCYPPPVVGDGFDRRCRVLRPLLGEPPLRLKIGSLTWWM